MKAFAKRVARALFGEYGLYEVWQSPAPIAPTFTPGLCARVVDADDLARSPDSELRASRVYAGSESRLYGLFEGDRMLCLACCWWGSRYASRVSWPLPVNAAKLVHLVTVEGARGRGLATMLIRHACWDMAEKGHRPLLARIWHSNVPSKRAFRSAGWARIGWLVQLSPLRRRSPFRICWRVGDSNSGTPRR
jgi:GNAT superfamily N-acetyltransferase